MGAEGISPDLSRRVAGCGHRGAVLFDGRGLRAGYDGDLGPGMVRRHDGVSPLPPANGVGAGERGLSALREGRDQAEARAVIIRHRAQEIDHASELCRAALHYGQAQSRAARFRGVERLEDAMLRVRRYPRSRIRHRKNEPRSAALAPDAGLDPDLPGRARGLDRIEYEVAQGFAERGSL